MVTKVKAPSYTERFKAARKPTIVNNVEDVTPKPLAASIQDDIKNLFTKYKVAVPSTTRMVIAFVAGICVSFGIGYVGSIIVEALVMAAVTFTASVTFGLVLYIFGLLATVYAGYITGNSVAHRIMSGDIDRSYQKCSNAVRGFFSFGNREVTS